MGVGDMTVGAVGGFAAGIAMDEGTLAIWSTEAEVRIGRSKPPEAVAGTEDLRVEAGAEMLSGAVG